MKSDSIESKLNSSDWKEMREMRTLNETNVVRFWYDEITDVMKVELINNSIINITKNDYRLEDLKILDNSKTFVDFCNKKINKKFVKDIKFILKPEYSVLITLTNNKQYTIDSKVLLS